MARGRRLQVRDNFPQKCWLAISESGGLAETLLTPRSVGYVSMHVMRMGRRARRGSRLHACNAYGKTSAWVATRWGEDSVSFRRQRHRKLTPEE